MDGERTWTFFVMESNLVIECHTASLRKSVRLSEGTQKKSFWKIGVIELRWWIRSLIDTKNSFKILSFHSILKTVDYQMFIEFAEKWNGKLITLRYLFLFRHRVWTSIFVINLKRLILNSSSFHLYERSKRCIFERKHETFCYRSFWEKLEKLSTKRLHVQVVSAEIRIRNSI